MVRIYRSRLCLLLKRHKDDLRKEKDRTNIKDGFYEIGEINSDSIFLISHNHLDLFDYIDCL